MGKNIREESYDIVIVGGGPAGVCAAIASARTGAETLLVERQAYLGGVSTSAMFQPWRGFHSLGKQVVTGIGEEIVARLQEAAGSPGHRVDPIGISLTVTPFDADVLKSVLLEMANTNNVRLIFDAQFNRARLKGNYVEAVEIRSPHGDNLLRAGVYIDATGRGTVAVSAGAGFVKHETSASYRFSMGGVDEKLLMEYVVRSPHEFSRTPSSTKVAFLSLKGFTSLTRKWHDEAPALADFDSIHIEGTSRAGEAVISMIELPNVNPDDPENLRRTAIRCEDLAAKGSQFLIRNCPGFEKAAVLKLASDIGFHSNRQVLGRITITDSDVLSGREFANAAATCAMPGRPDCTFQVPLDAFRLPGIENLIVTGRAILPPTALFATNSQPASMQLGEAAGNLAVELNKNLAMTR